MAIDWNDLRAWTVFGYGVLFAVYGTWLMARGMRQRTLRPIPGRLLFGLFLLSAAFGFLDVSWARWDRDMDRVADASSTVPFVIGLGFGIWGLIRFLRNDLDDD